MTLKDIKLFIDQAIPGAVLGEDLSSTPQALLVDPKRLFSVCELLHSHKKTYFDLLSCITGLDNGVETGTMEVVYNLYSIPFDLHLMVKCELNRNNPKIDSVTSIWRTANWHEREAFDLVGIKFQNHPDLRRILLPADWEGHPLQKDYQEQEKYHGITVVYDRDETTDGDSI